MTAQPTGTGPDEQPGVEWGLFFQEEGHRLACLRVAWRLGLVDQRPLDHALTYFRAIDVLPAADATRFVSGTDAEARTILDAAAQRKVAGTPFEQLMPDMAAYCWGAVLDGSNDAYVRGWYGDPGRSKQENSERLLAELERRYPPQPSEGDG